jgi:hypothetical protein
MVSDAYSLILQELGKLLKISDLQPDGNNSCLIKFPGKISVQIEQDKNPLYLLICCELGVISPGRYRENVFIEAMKSNGLLPPRHGDFAFSTVADKLILQEMVPLQSMNGDRLHALLLPFVEKARYWQEALAKGETPTAVQPAAQVKGGMFGLR